MVRANFQVLQAQVVVKQAHRIKQSQVQLLKVMLATPLAHQLPLVNPLRLTISLIVDYQVMASIYKEVLVVFLITKQLLMIAVILLGNLRMVFWSKSLRPHVRVATLRVTNTFWNL